MYRLFSAFQMNKKQYEKLNLRILGYSFQMHSTQISVLIHMNNRKNNTFDMSSTERASLHTWRHMPD